MPIISRRKFNVWWEAGYPYLFAFICAGGVLLTFPQIAMSRVSDLHRLADHALRINTVLLGFFLTMYGLTATINTRRMRWVKSSGNYPYLVLYNRVAIISQFVSILVVIFLSFYEFYAEHVEWDRWIAGLLTFVVVWSFAAGYRYAVIFLTLINDPKDLKRGERKKDDAG